MSHEDDWVIISQGEGGGCCQKRNDGKKGKKTILEEDLEVENKRIKLLEEKEGKGEVQAVQWKMNTIGEYKGSALIGPILEKFCRNLFDFEQINWLLEKANPVESLNLYRGF